MLMLSVSGFVKWLALAVCSRCCWLRKIVEHSYKVVPKVEAVKVKNDSSDAGVGSEEHDDMWCSEHASPMKRVRGVCVSCGKKFWKFMYCAEDKRMECERCYEREHGSV